MKKTKLLYGLLFFLALAGPLIAYQEIPEVPDPAEVPLTFLQQERSVVLQLLKYYSEIKGNETILHLGCRDGYLTNEIAKYLPEGRIVGLENVFVEEPKIGSNNVSFLQEKFVEQGWENCYDYVICTQFDECDNNPNELLFAIKKALKPGGIMLILTCTNTSLPPANPLHWRLEQPENQKYVPYLQFWSDVNFAEFQFLGDRHLDLSMVSVGSRRLFACFRDLEQFKEESRKWFRKIALLPQPRQEEVLGLLVDVVKEWHSASEDYYAFLYWLRIACYRKAG